MYGEPPVRPKIRTVLLAIITVESSYLRDMLSDNTYLCLGGLGPSAFDAPLGS